MKIIKERKMGIFKKLFAKKKKEKKEQDECWYNNAHEESFSARGEPLENVVGGTGLGGAYMSSSHANEKPQ